MHKLTLTVALATLLTLGGAGCSTTRPDGTPQPPVERIAPLVKSAAFVGTFSALRERPEWVGHFQLAASELYRIEAAERIDFTTILAIVYRLPIKELRSEEARLAVTAATILLTGYGGHLVELDKLENVRPIATALREGIELALPTGDPLTPIIGP